MRRRAATTIGLTALMLTAVAGPPLVSAQATADHPAVGAWMIDLSSEDAAGANGLVVIEPGGTIISAGAGESGYGSWAATGERGADATYLVPYSVPDAGFMGFGTVRASIEVAADGQRFAGTYTLELPAGMAPVIGAPVGQLGPGSVTGQRIAVDPMGEPVGPLPVEGPALAASPPTAESTGPAASATAPGAERRVIDIVATAPARFTDPAGVPVTDIAVTPGETVRFRIGNDAGFAHDFYIGTDEQLKVFAGTTDTGVPQFERGVQGFEWVVPADVTGLKFGCTLPGHYRVMQGTFSVSP